MAERLNAENFADKALQEGTLSLVDFYSDSCVPCKRMSPILAQLEETFQGKVAIGKVTIAYETELVEKYGVTSVPTFLFFKNGEQIEKLTGVQKKTELERIINENL